MKCSVVFVLAILPFVLTQRKDICPYGVDNILVIETSDSNIDRADTLGAIKRGLSELVESHDIGTGPLQTRFALCTYGDDAELVLALNDTRRQNIEGIKTIMGNSPFTGFLPRGGFNRIHLGIQCGLEAAKASEPGRIQNMMLLLVSNDRFSQAAAIGNVTLAKNSIYVSVLAVGNRFVDRTITEAYATASSAYTYIPSFLDFVRDAERARPTAFRSICPIDLTTTTTTTTTPPPPLGDPCDNCVIINGVGYAATEDCYSFYQCLRGDDNQWVEFRRPVAVGSFWNQRMLTGDKPDQAGCATDPCIGREDDAVVGGWSNCRAKITCRGGVTAFTECCPEGQSLSGGRCLIDRNCNDVCEPVSTTQGTCYLSPDVDGNEQRYMANDGDFTLSMPCAIGTVYNDGMCGCIHMDGPVPVRECREHPEVDIQFGPSGQVIDISRNKYSITTENFSTRETSPGIFVGVFDGTSKVRIGNPNTGKDTDMTLRVVYTSTGNVPNAAVVTDAECLGTRRTVAILDRNNAARGFVRTLPNDVTTVDGARTTGRNEVIMQYDGAQVMIDSNGVLSSAPAGVLMADSPFCDGIKLGSGGPRDADGFIGEIEAFQLFKCISDGPEGFRGLL